MAYSDDFYTSKTTVLRWNGSSWSALGGPGLFTGAVFQSLAFAPDGSPHVAFKSLLASGQASVIKWDGSSWTALGGFGISDGIAEYQSLAIASDG
ncbi:MAG: hypothetical protein IPL49_08010, partial [Saprospirales bacterium]|nr:hypothetical protein [Saprospirales bacterium]